MSKTTRVKFKTPHDDESDDREKQLAKAKRSEIEQITADVDLKLAERLDSILKISDTRKPKFLTNKPKVNPVEKDRGPSKPFSLKTAQPLTADSILATTKLKRRNLSKEEIKQRLANKYETLVPEVDPKRASVKLVKILSAGESIELGKNEARKQMERQMELSSVSGNRNALAGGVNSFVFEDGSENSTEENEPHLKIPPKKNPIAGAGSGAKLLAEKERQIEKARAKAKSEAMNLADNSRTETLSEKSNRKDINDCNRDVGDVIYEQDGEEEADDDGDQGSTDEDESEDELTETDSDSTVTND